MMRLPLLSTLFLGLILALSSCDDPKDKSRIATGNNTGGTNSGTVNGSPAIGTPPSAPLYTWRDYRPLFDQSGRVVFGIQRPNDPRGDSVLFQGRSFALASTFYRGRSIVREGENQGGMIDENGSFVLPMIYHKISGISDSGLVEVALLDSATGKISEGVVNLNGEFIVPLEYERADLLNRGHLIKIKKGKSWGLLSETGEQLLPMEYSEINQFQGGYGTIKKGGRYGLIDEKGTLVVEPKYLSIKGFRQGVALVKEKEQSYFIMGEDFKNINGEYYQAFAAISYQDPQTNNFGDNFGIPQDTIIRETFMTADGNIALAQENKWGVVGAAGDVVIPFENKSVGLKEGEWYGVK